MTLNNMSSWVMRDRLPGTLTLSHSSGGRLRMASPMTCRVSNRNSSSRCTTSPVPLRDNSSTDRCSRTSTYDESVVALLFDCFGLEIFETVQRLLVTTRHIVTSSGQPQDDRTLECQENRGC